MYMSYRIPSHDGWGSDHPPRTVALPQSFPVEPWPRPGAWIPALGGPRGPWGQ